MDIKLEESRWYEVTLSYGKKFIVFHKEGEFIFTDGSSKHSGDILPFAESVVFCREPENVLHIVDFLPDLEEE